MKNVVIETSRHNSTINGPLSDASPHIHGTTTDCFSLPISEVNALISKYRVKVECSKSQLAIKKRENKNLENEIKKLRQEKIKQKEKKSVKQKSDIVPQNDRLMIKMSSLETKALGMRSEIDELRREKFLFICKNDELVKDIIEKRQKMESLQKKRENLRSKLKTAEESKINEHRAEIEQLMLAETGLTGFKNVLKNENEKRQKELISSFVGNKETAKGPSFALNEKEMDSEEENDLKKIAQAKAALAEQRKLQGKERDQLRLREESLRREIAENESLLSEIFRVTKTDSVDQLVAHFSNLEDANNELFKTTKLLMEDVEALQESKIQAQAKFQNAEASKKQTLNRKDKELLESQEQLVELERSIDDAKVKGQELKTIIETLKLGLPAIIDKVAGAIGETVEINKENSLNELLAYLEKLTNCVVSIVKENKLDKNVFEPQKNVKFEEKVAEGVNEEESFDKEKDKESLRDSKMLNKEFEKEHYEKLLFGETRNDFEKMIRKDIGLHFNRLMKKKMVL